MGNDIKGKGKAKADIAPGSNWLALKATIAPPPKPDNSNPPRKRRRTMSTSAPDVPSSNEPSTSTSTPIPTPRAPPKRLIRGSDTDIPYLRSMILGHTVPPPASTSTPGAPDPNVKIGKYIALDCEMVGVGAPILANTNHSHTHHRSSSRHPSLPKLETESSLARVSLVNYDGELILDVFVRQKERVTDYRTFVSGVRAEDVVGERAWKFEDVQTKVAKVLEGRILVGHAVHNDLKALLLKHSSINTRDTQKNPAIRAAYKTKFPGLRTLVQKEFGIDIQAGEHSSVTDARATMALYRLYKNRTVDKRGKGVKDAQDAATENGSSESESDGPHPTLPSRSNAKKGPDGPFVESKLPAPSAPEVDSSDDEDEDEDDEPARAKGSRPVLGSSKKRKREEDESPLVLHVATSNTANPPSPPTSSSHPTSTHATKSSTRPKPKAISTKSLKSGSKMSGAGGGMKGISSGLSTVIRTNGVRKITGKRAPVGQKGRGAHLTGGGSALGSGDWWSKL